jgi:ubiquinone/menaquinone biosynthesis C-methylase UbiE
MNEVTPKTKIYDGYRKYDRQIANTYERDRQVETHWWREDEFIQDKLANRMVNHLLDIPVGTGRFFKHYNQVRNLTGIDISKDMLEEARKKLPLLPSTTSVALEIGDLFRLRFTDAHFDVAVVWRLFHLLPKCALAPAVSELCRVTRDEIIVHVYAADHPWVDRVRKQMLRVISRSRRLVSKRPVEARSQARPWSHIQAYSHRQSLIDSSFLAHGFVPSERKHLDRYERSSVIATVYVRK